MVFETSGGENKKIIFKSDTGEQMAELPLPASRDDIIKTAIDVAKKLGYGKFVIRTPNGVWSEPADIPATVNDPLELTIEASNKGA